MLFLGLFIRMRISLEEKQKLEYISSKNVNSSYKIAGEPEECSLPALIYKIERPFSQFALTVVTGRRDNYFIFIKW